MHHIPIHELVAYFTMPVIGFFITKHWFWRLKKEQTENEIFANDYRVYIILHILGWPYAVVHHTLHAAARRMAPIVEDGFTKIIGSFD